MALVGTYNRRVARPLGRSPGTRCRAEDIRTTHTASVRPRTRNSIEHRQLMDPDSDRGRRWSIPRRGALLARVGTLPWHQKAHRWTRPSCRGPRSLSRKRVNNILACLGKMLRYAHEIELIEIVPRVKLLKVPQQRFDFLTFEELSRLVRIPVHLSARSAWT